jgi:hypothetical protein
MSDNYTVINSNPEDLNMIFRYFDSAIEYQQKNGYDLWPKFSEELILQEISEGRHWKILKSEETVCIFSVIYSDPVIWGPEKNRDPSVYLHRIAINPAFKGNNIMQVIKDWATRHARMNGKMHVRMDTWGKNENLRNYYIKCGFRYIGQQYLRETKGLPAHYGGSELSLFEIEV